jgi:hypothetical protein
MIHPLLRLVATQPELLADHAQAYAGLAGEELARAAADWKRRAVLNASALALLSVAAALAGVALMLWAVVPAASIQAPWALLAAPAVPAFVGVCCLLAGRGADIDRFADLRQQLAADLVMLREVGAG